jgi:hypothetical protein
MMSKLIGVSGFARSGKDTFCNRSAKYLNFYKNKVKIFSFADALKNELNELLLQNVGISAFTEKDEEKEIIRPLLVTYGTHLRRKLNENCWVDKIRSSVMHHVNRGTFVFITDVRFLNEAEWIKDSNGILFNIQRNGVSAANKEESEQFKLFKPLIDYSIKWPTFGDKNINKCDDYILKLIGNPKNKVDFFPIHTDYINRKKNLISHE